MTTKLEYDQITRIKVFGIGGAGCNAVNRMVNDGVKGVEFYVCNTDLQVLNHSKCSNKILLGRNLTKGLGAGGMPEIGAKAAQESEEEIKQKISGADMVFIACGEGGGTGTGAAPVFAKVAKEFGALTVAVVTTPFEFEGRKRNDQATIGLDKLKEYTDSVIVVSNNKILQVIGKIPMKDAFREADNILRQGVQTITDLIAVPAFINLDFADVRNIMQNKGSALIGIGMAQGDNKAKEAAERAINSPLLEANINGAKSAIINITGNDISIYDANIAVNCVKEAAGNDIELIWGVALNESLGESIIVTVIATGFELPNTINTRQNTTVFINPTNNRNVPQTNNPAPAHAPRQQKTVAPKKSTVSVIENTEEDDTPDFFKNRF